jgi:hypothetical protein
MFFPPDLAYLDYRRTQRHGPQIQSSTQPPASATNRSQVDEREGSQQPLALDP